MSVWLRRLSAVNSVSLEDVELQAHFLQRVVVPVMEKIGEISTRFTPQKLLQETTLRKLELAGNPWPRMTLPLFGRPALLARQFLAGIALPLLFYPRRGHQQELFLWSYILLHWVSSSRNCGCRAG